MKTVTSTLLYLFVIASTLAIASASYAKEPTKTQGDANAIKLKDGSLVGGFSLSAQVTQKDPESEEKKDSDPKEKEGRPLLLGKAVYLVTEMVNVSHDELKFIETYPEMDFRVVMLDSKGNQVPRTPYGEQWLKRQNNPPAPFVRLHLRRIPPGKSQQRKIDLSRQFDLSHAGTYSVQASFKTFKKPGHAELKSNVVVFELEQTK